jgi:hypothetical protein
MAPPGTTRCSSSKALILGERCDDRHKPAWARVATGLCYEQATNQKHQTVMIVTGVASNWEYSSPRTNQSLKSAFSGGNHD